MSEYDEPRSANRPAGAGRVPPHNLQAEESLLGAMLLSKEAVSIASEVLTADNFYKPAHAHIFDAITSLSAAGEPADPVTVAEELSRAGLLDAIGGPATLVTLQAATPAVSSASRYARIIEEHALLRRLIGVAGEIAEMSYSLPEDVTKTVDQAETMVFEVAQRRATDTLAPLSDLLGTSTISKTSSVVAKQLLVCPQVSLTSTNCCRVCNQTRFTWLALVPQWERPRLHSAWPATQQSNRTDPCCCSRSKWANSNSRNVCCVPRLASIHAKCAPVNSLNPIGARSHTPPAVSPTHPFGSTTTPTSPSWKFAPRRGACAARCGG